MTVFSLNFVLACLAVACLMAAGLSGLEVRVVRTDLALGKAGSEKGGNPGVMRASARVVWEFWPDCVPWGMLTLQSYPELRVPS